MFTIQNVKDHLINHSVALRHTLDENENFRNGTLKADKGTIYFIPETLNEGERSQWVMEVISVDDDNKLTKIDSNRMAKEFVRTYSLIELQKEFMNVYLNRPEWVSVTIESHYKNVVSKYLETNNIKYSCNSEFIKINNVECVYFNIYISKNEAKNLIAFLDELHY